ncbi:DNA-binding response regulator [Clostridia bacterium]|nr:DNA-binding response regulator [Clostridia bacterium]
MGHRILVVDDEKLIVKGLKFSLEQDDMIVDTAFDGEEGLKLARDNAYSLIFLDVMLPKLDGIEVCQQIREFSRVPIIMLTAKSNDMDKIMGLEVGADDYVTKPFNILELKARLRAILRRSAKSDGAVQSSRVPKLNYNGLEIIASSRRGFINGTEVNLTAKEFDLIEMLMKNPGKVYSREDLLMSVWGPGSSADVRTVDVHVRRLREKIEEKPKEPKFIVTKWGVGYYFDA